MKFGKIEHFIFFGSGEVLKYCSEVLAEKGKSITIFTSERLYSSALSNEFLRYKSIRYLKIDKLTNNKILTDLTKNNNCLGISFGSPWIFKKETINLFHKKLVNLHSMPLPKFRGGASFSWMILAGTKQGNCLLHFVDEGIDTGGVIQTKEFRYPETVKRPIDYEKVLVEENKKFMLDFLDKCQLDFDFQESIFPEYLSIYFPRLSTSVNGCINWNWDGDEIYRFINAFDEPYEGARTTLYSENVKIKNVEYESSWIQVHPFMCGIVYRKSANKLFVFVKGGVLLISELYNDKNESIIDTIKVGDRLHTPQSLLDESLQSRVFFLPDGMKTKK